MSGKVKNFVVRKQTRLAEGFNGGFCRTLSQINIIVPRADPSKRRDTMRTTSCQTQDSVRVSLGVRPVHRLNDAVKLAWLEKPSRKASSDSLTSSLSR